VQPGKPPSAPALRAAGRNGPCACGSGLRTKHCCGLTASGAAPRIFARDRRRTAGLQAQQRGDYSAAIEVYGAILREFPDDWDVAHMRATCFYQMGALDAARAAFAALLATPAADVPGYWNNLGLVLAATCADPWSPALRERMAAYRRLRPLRPAAVSAPDRAALPGVSVVIPAYMHERYVEEAIRSVLAQTLAPLELIVIDDGSRDATVACCERALAGAAWPVRLIARENRGAAATINEGIALARGEYVQLLNSDDRLPPRRLEAMLAALVAQDAAWGYARVTPIDAAGVPLGTASGERAAMLLAIQDAALMSHTLGLSLLRANSTISSGNLMFRKSLWEAVGGFADYRYNHDWDFCLRASLLAEPLLVPEPLYDYRTHDRNTITEADGAARAERERLTAAFVARALSRPDWPNPFAPVPAVWGGEALALLGAIDAARHLPRAMVADALAARSPR